MNQALPVEIKLYDPTEKSTMQYEVIPVGERLYQLKENHPFSESLIYGTIIEVEAFEKEAGVFQLKKIHQKSEYTLEIIGLPPSLHEPELRIVGDLILAAGGYWEVNFGGMGYVSLPKGSTLNVLEELNKLIRQKRSQ